MALYYGGSSACRVVCYSKIPTPQTTTKFLNQRLIDVSKDWRKNSAIRFQEMVRMVGVLKHPDEIYPLLKLKKSMEEAAKQIPTQPHWAFSYSVLHNFTGLALVFQRLDNHTHLRDAMCAFYLILRTLDTIEDDLSIPTDVKGPILKEFHSHIYEPNWQFSCGSTQQQKSLVDQFHHVSTAFLELQESYQEIIVDITKRMGAGMAEYLCKEVETINEYNEYCHYVAGLVVVGVFKLFHASGLEEHVPDYLPNAMGLFLQKVDGILDYTEDMNQLPKPRLMWPRQTWSKYVEKLEDLKCEENSVKAVQCLDDMATDALVHFDDCLKAMSSLRDPGNFMFCAFPLIKGLGNLAFCYNNIEVFRRNVKMRIGLAAKLIDRTKDMSDFYGACFDFCCMMKSKVDMSDPNATTTLNQLEAILKTCRESGQLIKRKSVAL